MQTNKNVAKSLNDKLTNKKTTFESCKRVFTKVVGDNSCQNFTHKYISENVYNTTFMSNFI